MVCGHQPDLQRLWGSVERVAIVEAQRAVWVKARDGVDRGTRRTTSAGGEQKTEE